jgi:hypothetical protein
MNDESFKDFVDRNLEGMRKDPQTKAALERIEARQAERTRRARIRREQAERRRSLRLIQGGRT